jgi:1-acyl-sn-glycerol-3-phosphate acyltransferase
MVAGFILAKISFDVPATAWVMLKLGHLFGDDKDIRKGRTQWN